MPAPPPQDDSASAIQAPEPEIAAVETVDGRPPGYFAAGGQMAGPTSPGALPMHGWPRFAAALRFQDYRRLWTGALISNVGSWMQNVARDWLVLQLGGVTGNLWLGLNAFAEGVPLLLLLPLGGVLADRFDRRRILIITNAFNAVLALGAALLTVLGMLRGWHILALTAGTAAMDALRIPANQSMLPDLVDHDNIPNAIALNSMQFNMSRILGPALGGMTLMWFGPAWSFSFNGLSFIGVIIPLAMLRRRPTSRSGRETMLQSLRQGAGYVLGRRDLLVMLLLVITGGFLAAPVTKFLSAMSQQVYHRGETGFTMLLSCFGVGAVIGAVLMAARSERRPTPWRAFPILMGLGLCQIAMAYNPYFPLALALVMLCGMCFIGTMIRLNTTILQTTPHAMRGRAASFHVLAFRLGMPLGGLLAGVISHTYGLRVVYLAFGLAMLVIVPLMLIAARQQRIDLGGEHHLATTPGDAPPPGSPGRPGTPGSPGSPGPPGTLP